MIRHLLTIGLIACASAVGTCASHAEVATQPPDLSPEWTKTEKFVWSKLLEGKTADLDDADNCPDGRPTPRDDHDPRWKNDCRKIHASFLDDVLTRKPWRDAIPHQGVRIKGGDVVGDVDLEGAELVSEISIESSRFEDSISISYAHTPRLISLSGTLVIGAFDASGFHSDSDLWLRDGTVVRQNVILRSTKIGGNLDMDGAIVVGQIAGQALEVGKSFFMRDARSFGAVSLVYARLDSSFDLRGATLADIDLSGASIAGELALAGTCPGSTWHGTPGKFVGLTLRNAKVGSLMDAEQVWPNQGRLFLDGFTLSRLPSFCGATSSEMLARGMDWWDHWARLDSGSKSAPYIQLANAFTAIGDREAANDIRFLGRVRERQAQTRWWPWLGAMALEYVAGFGIGTHTFRVLYWIIDLTIVGAAVLWLTVPAASAPNRGRLWCFGASLSRLLPIIEVNKEFTDFFNDPTRTNLKGWQTTVFSILGLLGWGLGAILIAAVSGLTQNP
jgi:hypothetical protein